MHFEKLTVSSPSSSVTCGRGSKRTASRYYQLSSCCNSQGPLKRLCACTFTIRLIEQRNLIHDCLIQIDNQSEKNHHYSSQVVLDEYLLQIVLMVGSNRTVRGYSMGENNKSWLTKMNESNREEKHSSDDAVSLTA